MRTFEIQYSGGSSQVFTGEYKITDSGVLAVLPSAGEPFILSPSMWARVTIKDAAEKTTFDDLLVD